MIILVYNKLVDLFDLLSALAKFLRPLSSFFHEISNRCLRLAMKDCLEREQCERIVRNSTTLSRKAQKHLRWCEFCQSDLEEARQSYIRILSGDRLPTDTVICSCGQMMEAWWLFCSACCKQNEECHWESWAEALNEKEVDEERQEKNKSAKPGWIKNILSNTKRWFEEDDVSDFNTK